MHTNGILRVHVEHIGTNSTVHVNDESSTKSVPKYLIL